MRTKPRAVFLIFSLDGEAIAHDIEVNVDRVRILQVLVDCFRNASDAMGDQCLLPNSCSDARDADRDFDEIRFTARNTGLDC